ncbi:hypothetical protein ACFVFQ_06865 [Streptomyces sp. NPDC057743]|uniref:hypothetical protein n=1 Tax=Streptomyces sp. NPDC057743 TaxID=3346236 RepID=UPI00369601A4
MPGARPSLVGEPDGRARSPEGISLTMALVALISPINSGSCAANAVRHDGPEYLDHARRRRARRWHGRILTAAGLALLPWLGYLAGTLPLSQAAPWIALDTLEAAALLTAGARLIRADPRHTTPATIAAALLLADVYLDLSTAAPGPALATAAIMAATAELPLTALCAWLATQPSGGTSSRGAR